MRTMRLKETSVSYTDPASLGYAGSVVKQVQSISDLEHISHMLKVTSMAIVKLPCMV